MTKKSFEFSRSFVRFVDFKSSAAVLLVSAFPRRAGIACKSAKNLGDHFSLIFINVKPTGKYFIRQLFS